MSLFENIKVKELVKDKRAAIVLDTSATLEQVSDILYKNCLTAIPIQKTNGKYATTTR